MTERTWVFTLSISTIVVILGCSVSKHTPPRISFQSLEQNAVIVGSGGGFTGAYNGFVITGSGDVFSWQSPGGMPDSLDLLFHTSADSANFFSRYLDEIGFNDISFRSAGNMNFFIERTTAQSKHRVQWAADAAVSPPPEIAAFYSLVCNFTLRNSHKQ